MGSRLPGSFVSPLRFGHLVTDLRTRDNRFVTGQATRGCHPCDGTTGLLPRAQDRCPDGNAAVQSPIDCLHDPQCASSAHRGLARCHQIVTSCRKSRRHKHVFARVTRTPGQVNTPLPLGCPDQGRARNRGGEAPVHGGLPGALLRRVGRTPVKTRVTNGDRSIRGQSNGERILPRWTDPFGARTTETNWRNNGLALLKDVFPAGCAQRDFSCQAVKIYC